MRKTKGGGGEVGISGKKLKFTEWYLLNTNLMHSGHTGIFHEIKS
jgi:hypothetical protein